MGAGSWGTAMARLLANKKHSVRLWVRDENLAQLMDKERENKKYLPGVRLPRQNLRIFTKLEELRDTSSEVFLFVVPSFAMRELARKLSHILSPTQKQQCAFVNLAKGIEALKAHSIKTMSEVLHDELASEHIFTLSGPSFAYEVGQDYPTTVVLAGQNLELGRKLQQTFMTERFRVYLSDDIKGVELGGSVKNIIALAAGISDGLGFGDNAKGALIARGLAEMIRLSTRLGARKETFFGLAGLGDLVATCTSCRSRNRAVGERIGRGESLNAILKGMEMVAEGVYATQAVHEIATKYQIEMPITAAVYAVLYEGASPKDKLRELMTREPKAEIL